MRSGCKKDVCLHFTKSLLVIGWYLGATHIDVMTASLHDRWNEKIFTDIDMDISFLSKYVWFFENILKLDFA
jgi:hypothetical protein